MLRKKTRKIKVGQVYIGGDSPISIQSMTNTDTKDIKATVRQIKKMEDHGCDIVRSAITDMEDAKAIPEIKKHISIPLIGDIQYDYRLALEAIKYGVDGLRLNPGNIGSLDRVKQVVEACKEAGISIRVGVNSGSIKQEYLDQYGGVNEDSMVYSALEQIKVLEDMDFYDIKVSLKASSVRLSLKANEKMAELRDYPLHLGITEAGPIWRGTIKSSVGMGAMLSRGLGDTIRISLTGDPVEEVKVAREILKSLGLRKEGIDIISCPTCGRTKIDLISLVEEAEKRMEGIDKNITVAIMGCAVNGPGEAREADIGIAGGKGEGILFKNGEIIRKMPEDEFLQALIEEIEKL